jgi:phage terminase large subunit GpA-like protein
VVCAVSLISVPPQRELRVDVQDDRLECEGRGWAEGFSSWLVDHVVISGSPRDREPWDEVAQVLARDCVSI